MRAVPEPRSAPSGPAAADASRPVPRSRAATRALGRNVNLGLFAVSVALCALSVFASSTGYLVVPFIGLATIVIAIVHRSWWTILLGLVEIISPALLIYLVYALLAAGF